MYETFTLRQTGKGIIEGQHWPVDHPRCVVCIIHGIGEYGGRYERVAGRFNEAGYAVIAMDLRGHGHSMNKWGHCAPRTEIMDDISALITYAQLTYKDVPLILYGHSMGGNIGLDYRRRGGLNDVPAAYIITAPWIRLARPIPAALYYLMKGMAKIRPSMILSSDVDESKLGNPENVLPYNDNPMVHNKISALCAVEGFEIGRGLERGTLAESGRADHIPMLLMHGTDDQICDITGTQKLAQRITRQGQPVEYIEWEGLYHEIHNGGPDSTGDEVIDKMVDFIGTFC